MEFNPDFINRMLSRLEWPAFVGTAKELGVGEGLPDMLPENHHIDDEELLKRVSSTCLSGYSVRIKIPSRPN